MAVSAGGRWRALCFLMRRFCPRRQPSTGAWGSPAPLIWHLEWDCGQTAAMSRFRHTTSRQQQVTPGGEDGMSEPPLPTGTGSQQDLQALLQEFPQPKNLLVQVMQRALKASNVNDHIVYKSFDGYIKKTVLYISWPRKLKVEGFGNKKVVAEKHAAAAACRIFKKI
ncbi:ATP-dependent RNA helicase DHX30-like [Rhincodon typus]|uniref:ATP-dependent RNA helicase DHX30-like n=1 Tax=Rhincodon typus TaxID=259920 RepID=UPI00202F8CFE|nr:ATP-dependent RNA helicase DHX30-like [Rhincodon typus]